MREVEVKLWYDSNLKINLISYFKEHDFHMVGQEIQVDDYYNHPARDFKETDEALRIRSMKDIVNKIEQTVLTYKGKNCFNNGQSREELECEIKDADILRLMLDRLGFSRVQAVYKERIIYRKEEISYCLDEVEGLGSFVEIEIICEDYEEVQTQQRLTSLVKELSFINPRIEPKTYLDLLVK